MKKFRRTMPGGDASVALCAEYQSADQGLGGLIAGRLLMSAALEGDHADHY